MSKTEAQMRAFRAIPAEKFAVKVKRTVLGVGVAALGILLTAYAGAPWWVAAGGGLLGATIWSGEMVTGAVKLIGAVVVDLWVKAKGPTP